jgi:hypothetical protein
LDPIDATAQAPDTQPVAAQPGTEHQADNSGIQKRIDELTAKYRQAEDALRQRDAQNQELMMALMTQRAAPAAAEPPPEFDPEEKRKLDYVTAPLMQRMEQMQKQFERQMGAVQLQQTTQRVGDPEVAREAQALYQKWQGNPDVKGFNAEDAVIYAAGKKALAAQLAANANAALQNFNNGAPPPMFNGRQPPSAPVEAAVPADIDTWDNDKQAAYWEKQLAGKAF